MKVIIYMAMSVDGYIADETDEAPWSDVIWNRYITAVEQYNNIVVGRRTYEVMQSGQDFDSFSNRPFTVVLSRNTTFEIDPQDVIASSITEVLKHLKDKGFEEVLIGGGAQTAKAFLDAKVVDEIHLDMEPILLGNGIQFLGNFSAVLLKKKLVAELEKGVIHLEYEVVK